MATWAQAAGRKAGSGNVQFVARGPTTEKRPPKKKNNGAPPQPTAADEAHIRATLAVESLERAMDSRELEAVRSAIERFSVDANGTDALWRAQHMKKDLLHQAKNSRKQSEADAKAGQSEAADPAIASAALEAAMETNDLATLKAAIESHSAAAEDTDALEHARFMLKRLQEERKAEKKKRLKESGPAKPKAAAEPTDEEEAPTEAHADEELTAVLPPAQVAVEAPPNVASAAATTAADEPSSAVDALEAAIRHGDAESLDAALLAAHAANAPLSLITKAVLRRAELASPASASAPTPVATVAPLAAPPGCE